MLPNMAEIQVIIVQQRSASFLEMPFAVLTMCLIFY